MPEKELENRQHGSKMGKAIDLPNRKGLSRNLPGPILPAGASSGPTLVIGQVCDHSVISSINGGISNSCRQREFLSHEFLVEILFLICFMMSAIGG